MEAYKTETTEILKRFTEGRISHPECLAALDAALSDLVPRLDPGDLRTVQAMIRATNDAVVAEVKRRGPVNFN